jgi:hypothetical protein
MIDVEKAIAHERKWDPSLGGEDTRVYRELLCYCAARMIRGAGAQLDDVLDYVRDTFETFAPEELAGTASKEHQA